MVPTNTSGRLSRALRSAAGPSTFVPSASMPPASIGNPSRVVVRHCPTGSKFSSAKPTGSMLRWQEAQTGLARWRSSCSRTVDGRSLCALSSRSGTTAGGGSGGVFSRFEMMYFPRRTGEVRVATAVSDRMLPWPSRPRRFWSLTGTRRNCEP
jgi:hypothetical protein